MNPKAHSATPIRALLMLSASHAVSDPTGPKVPRYLQLSQWVSCNGLMKKSLSYLSLVQELEDSCPVCVRPYNHGTSWDSGQVAGSPLCYISRAAVAAQKLEVLGAKLLGPSRKSSSWKQTENADKMDIRQGWYFWLQVCFKHYIHMRSRIQLSWASLKYCWLYNVSYACTSSFRLISPTRYTA